MKAAAGGNPYHTGHSVWDFFSHLMKRVSNNFQRHLTAKKKSAPQSKKDEDEMEVATSEVVPVAVVKTEPIEIANVNNVNAVTIRMLMSTSSGWGRPLIEKVNPVGSAGRVLVPCPRAIP
jgi:hypothetical protein